MLTSYNAGHFAIGGQHQSPSNNPKEKLNKKFGQPKKKSTGKKSTGKKSKGGKDNG